VRATREDCENIGIIQRVASEQHIPIDRFKRQNPNHWLAITRLGCRLSVNGLCWGFEARPRKYQRRQSDHTPLGGVVRSVTRFTLAPVVFSWDARAHNPICYLRGALGDAGAAAASLRVATYRPHAGRQRTLTP
jgi:hypothetical protein